MQLDTSVTNGFRELTSEELYAVTGGTNPIEHSHNMDAASSSESALQISDRIQGISASENYEYGAMIVANADGTFGAANDGIHTDYSSSNVSLGTVDDYSSVVGIVHNHPWDTSNFYDNLADRYPSTADWAALDQLVSNGANPNNLSIFILDGFGNLREFKYSDKAIFINMSLSDKWNGVNLTADMMVSSGSNDDDSSGDNGGEDGDDSDADGEGEGDDGYSDDGDSDYHDDNDDEDPEGEVYGPGEEYDEWEEENEA